MVKQQQEYMNNSLYLPQTYALVFVHRHLISIPEKETVFGEISPRRTVSFEVQITFKGKYSSTVSCQLEDFVLKSFI